MLKLIVKVRVETFWRHVSTITIIIMLMLTLPVFAIGPYVDNADNTVTDTTTNLRWQKCSMGQTQDAACSAPAATTANWSGALQYCNGLSLGTGSPPWRLPNVNELMSLVDNSVFNPSIKTANFPATVSYYWSSSTYVGSFNSAWVVSFFNGSSSYGNGKPLNYSVRCVTTGP